MWSGDVIWCSLGRRRPSRAAVQVGRQRSTDLIDAPARTLARSSPDWHLRILVQAVRLMRAATQTAATDPLTGAIDMDMITTGRSAADRNMQQHLIENLKLKIGMMGTNQTLEVKDVQRLVQEEAGVEVEGSKVREAMAQLAKEGILRQLRQSVFSVM